MNSIGLAIALLCGNALGLLILGRRPEGLEAAYGFGLLGLAVAATLPAIIARGNRRAVWSSLLVAFAVAGCGRALLTHPPVTPDDLAYYNGANGTPAGPIITVAGVISSEPVFSDKAQTIRVSAHTIKDKQDPKGRPVAGDMYAIITRYPEHQLGETVSLSGKLTAPPTYAGFDYAAYLAHLGVFSYMSFPKVSVQAQAGQSGLEGYIAAQRVAARHTLESVVAEPEASIAVGVVTGDRTSMSADIKAAFRSSGTTHILAISGENIALLVGLIFVFAAGGPVKRRLPIWLAIPVISLVVIYAIFTGATPSVLRATVMAVALLLGPLLGRRYDGVAALAVSAAIMAVFSPNLLSDAGFLLSFGAMVGIATVSPLVQGSLVRVHVPAVLAAPVAVSVGAIAATMPLSALLIGQVSLVSPFATLTADFTLAPLMISGIMTTLAGIVGTQLAAIPGLLVWACSGWLLGNAQLWASLPGASIDTSGVTILHVLVYYAMLFAAVYMFSSPQRRERLKVLNARLGTAVLAVVAVVAWAAALILILT
jgi:competence protein ComEC